MPETAKVVDIDAQLVSASAMASHLGLSDERVRQLAAQGVVVQVGRNKYDLMESSKGYIRFLQERSSSSVVSEDQDYNYWRAENEKNKALLGELAVQEKEGILANKVEVQQAIGHAVVAGRRLIESAAGQLRVKFPEMTNDQISEVEKFLKRLQNELARVEF